MRININQIFNQFLRVHFLELIFKSKQYSHVPVFLSKRLVKMTKSLFIYYENILIPLNILIINIKIDNSGIILTVQVIPKKLFIKQQLKV